VNEEKLRDLHEGRRVSIAEADDAIPQEKAQAASAHLDPSNTLETA
jgi:hypothetical protein